jgi:hypothetical protein
LHANIQGRRWLKGGLAVVYAVLAVAAGTLFAMQYTTPWREEAAYFSPLSRRGVTHGDVLFAMLLHVLCCGAAAYLSASRAPTAPMSKLTFTLSLWPLVHFGYLYVVLGLWDEWGYLWVPLGPLALHAAQHYCHRMFDRMDREVLDLVKLQYRAKSA